MNEDALKKIALDGQLTSLYSNNLFSIKSICEHLGTWDSYTKEEKYKLENLTHRDSLINKNFKEIRQKNYDLKFTYGEISREGVEQIISLIQKHKRVIGPKDVFIDIGSGCGKLLIHLALNTNFKTLVGIEIVKERVDYAKHIYQYFHPIEDKKVFFINKNVLEFDLSIATMVYMNNLCFERKMVLEIYERLPKGCHIISAVPLDCIYLKEQIKLEVTWESKRFLHYYYVK